MPAPLSGRYALVRQLGTGQHSIIFEATDLKLGRAVAVKIIAPGPGGTRPPADVTRRLEWEGRIAASLSHPNLCAVTDIDRLEDGLPFLVLELLAGETLATRLERRGSLAVHEALEIGEQLLAGLGAAHSRGVIHRDIKPANVFLLHVGVDRTVVKLLDFGIARVPEMLEEEPRPLTATGFVVGTPEYMSPEQVRGHRELDARTDVYSSGIVFYEMLTGARPFKDRPRAELLEAIAFEAIPPLASIAPHVPPVVARAVDVAVSRDPARRHLDANTFLRALRSVASVAVPSRTGETQILAKRSSPDEWDTATRPSAPPDMPSSADADADVGSDVGTTGDGTRRSRLA